MVGVASSMLVEHTQAWTAVVVAEKGLVMLGRSVGCSRWPGLWEFGRSWTGCALEADPPHMEETIFCMGYMAWKRLKLK